MNTPAITALVYGALVFAGGWVGYKKAGSRPSLISSSLSAAVLLIAAVLSLSGISAGNMVAMVVALVLLVFFGYRLAKGGKFMPAGLMVAVSLATLVVLWTFRPR